MEEFVYTFKCTATDVGSFTDQMPPRASINVDGGLELLYGSILAGYVCWKLGGNIEFFRLHWLSLSVCVVRADKNTAGMVAKIKGNQDVGLIHTTMEETALDRCQGYLDLCSELQTLGQATTVPGIQKALKAENFVNKTDNMSKQRTLAAIKACAQVFIVPTVVRLALKKTESHHGPELFTKYLWRLNALQRFALEKCPTHMARLVTTLSAMVTRGEIKSADAVSVSALVNGKKEAEEEGDAPQLECGLAAFGSLRLLAADQLCNSFAFSEVVTKNFA